MGRPMTKRVLILTVIPAELSNLLAELGCAPSEKSPLMEMYYYWRAKASLEVTNEQLDLVVCAAAKAGNVNMGVFAANVISALKPDFAILLGIAAGLRGKTKIGQVVFGEKTVAYEPGALVSGPEGAGFEPRPDMIEPDFGIVQMLTAYVADERAMTRIDQEGRFPRWDSLPAKLQENPEVREHVADDLLMNFAAVASGEKLLRDPSKIRELRKNTHGRIEIAEMEAVGFGTACAHARLPNLVIRGVSDFGDHLKDDEFHVYAAKRAARVAIDFVRCGLDFRLLPQRRAAGTAQARDAGESEQAEDAPPLNSYFDADAARSLQAIKQSHATMRDACVCAFISVSPSTTGPRDPKRCYHLGHALAGQIFSEFYEGVFPLELLITPSSNYWQPRDAAQNKANFEIFGNWFSAFGFELEPTLIHRYIYNLDMDRTMADLQSRVQNLWIYAANQFLGDTRNTMLRWRFTGELSEQRRSAIFARFDGNRDLDGVNLSDRDAQEEFLAFLYVVLAQSRWASADWMVKCVHSFTDPERSVARRHFGKSTMLIVESSKNRTVWDALSFVSRIADPPTPFPRRIYFKTLKNTALADWMYSRNAATIVPLWGDVGVTVSGLRDRFVEHALGLLNPSLADDMETGRKWLSEFAISWQHKLRQSANA
jgi:nucleoside phosphorylase